MILSEIKGVLSDAERHDAMQLAVNTRLPFLTPAPPTDKRISIVCYGPSLEQTWEQIKPPIVAMSGSYDFLLPKTIIPDYYIAIDPRQSAVELLHHRGTTTVYLMATVCHPDWWEKLPPGRVKLWHLINDENTVKWIKEHDPLHWESAVGGGSTVGERALHVMNRFFGYTKFDIYGMDCSFAEDGQRHAGPHNAERHPEIIVEVMGRKFRTSPQFLKAAHEMMDLINTSGVEITLHGDGLLQTLVERERYLT